MNKERRQRISDSVSGLEDCISELEGVISDEQDAYDSLPESFQFGERGEAMQDAIDKLSEFVDDLEDIKDRILGWENS